MRACLVAGGGGAACPPGAAEGEGESEFPTFDATLLDMVGGELTEIPVGRMLRAPLAHGDLDADGSLDRVEAVATEDGVPVSDDVVVTLGAYSGASREVQSPGALAGVDPTQSGPWRFCAFVADMDGDGLDDVVALARGRVGVRILPGRVDGTFAEGTTCGSKPGSTAAARSRARTTAGTTRAAARPSTTALCSTVDGDGDRDVVLVSSSFTVFIQDAPGAFTRVTSAALIADADRSYVLVRMEVLGKGPDASVVVVAEGARHVSRWLLMAQRRSRGFVCCPSRATAPRCASCAPAAWWWTGTATRTAATRAAIRARRRPRHAVGVLPTHRGPRRGRRARPRAARPAAPLRPALRHGPADRQSSFLVGGLWGLILHAHPAPCLSGGSRARRVRHPAR